jgi:hypothetical protein
MLPGQPNLLIQRLIRRFRRRRLEQFARTFAITAETRILDVGGLESTWDLLPVRPRVTLLNLPAAAAAGALRQGTRVFGDGCQLPFRDQSFDIVFSNSVIEHLGSSARQCLFASEIQRVGRSYFVQTPNSGFPVEHHLLTPFLHWLPRDWQRRLVPHFNVWQLVTRPTADAREYYLNHYLNEIRLLNRRQLAAFFPGATIRVERWLGLAKSLIAIQ